MTEQRSLQGTCSCGRYTYVVAIPENQKDQAQVHFRTDDEHRRSQAALLTAFLRVPLTWYTSRTTPFFPDETHHSISRTFSPLDESRSQRKFCGYCGTHLSYWTEEPRDEQDYLHITLGSLKNRDLDVLQDLDLIPEDVSLERPLKELNVTEVANDSSAVDTNQVDGVGRSIRHGRDGSMTWFEEMLSGSHMGRARTTRRGIGASADGSTSVSWEVTEYGDDDDDDVVMTGSTSGAKRKLDEAVSDTKT